MKRWVALSPCGSYRYLLGRRWDLGPTLGWVMLNPSTADGETDDPTIRRVVAFSKSFGASACLVGNLYALRATDPRELRHHEDPVGPENGAWLDQLFDESDLGVVAAWGNPVYPSAELVRLRVWTTMLGRDLVCLGMTITEHPRHPLYVPASQRFEHFAGDPPYASAPS